MQGLLTENGHKQLTTPLWRNLVYINYTLASGKANIKQDLETNK